MINATTIVVLPVGELDTEFVRNEFESRVEVLKRLAVNLLVAETVSNEEEARQSVQNLSVKNPDLFLIIPLRGLSAQVIEAAALASHVPCLICPVQGRFALPSSALAIGALHEAKVPVELLYAPADHHEFTRRLSHIVRAAKAYAQIKKSRIGVIGSLFPNLVACRYDPHIVSSRLGITILPITFNEIGDSLQLESQGSREGEELRQKIISSYAVESSDVIALDAGIKLHLVLKQVALERKIDGFATECWSGFPKELGLNPCLGFIEDAYSLACEGDVMLCVSLLFVRYLTGSSAFVGDLYDLDLDGLLTLVHCGAPASLASNKKAVVLGKSQLALERGFETMTCRPPLDRGTVTIFRIYGRACDKLHLASGELKSSEQSPNLTVKVRINANRWDFLDQCLGNHYVVASGDIRSELKLLCKWLGITMIET